METQWLTGKEKVPETGINKECRLLWNDQRLFWFVNSASYCWFLRENPPYLLNTPRVWCLNYSHLINRYIFRFSRTYSMDRKKDAKKERKTDRLNKKKYLKGVIQEDINHVSIFLEKLENEINELWFISSLYGKVLWDINHYGLFHAKSCLCIYIKYIKYMNCLYSVILGAILTNTSTSI